MAAGTAAEATVVQLGDYTDFLSETIDSYTGADINRPTGDPFVENGTSAAITVNGVSYPGLVRGDYLTGPLEFSSFSAFEIGMTFGRDTSAVSTVTLAVYMDATALGEVMVTANQDAVPNQFIGLRSNVAFNRAILTYTSTSSGTPPFITQLDFGITVPIPLPAGLPLFAAALGFLALLGWRRRRAAAADAVIPGPPGSG